MSTYTAVVGDARSIGAASLVHVSSQETDSGPQFARLNPQLATARIRTIIAPHTVQDALGGYISADFTIPAEEALRWKPALRYGAVCWLFDGQAPIFHGWLEQPVWTSSGDAQITLSGAWNLLGRSRMRELWELWDMSLLQRGTGSAENKAGQVNINGDGSMTLSWPNGTVLANGDRCSVTYTLFGEAAGNADGKKITAFEFDISDSANLSANNRIRVFGGTSPASTPDQLWDSGSGGSSGIQDSLNLNGANQGGAAWGQHSGYRCLRFELFRVSAGTSTLANDTYATFDRIRITSRAALFPTAGVGGIDTAALARDTIRPSNYSGTITFGGTNNAALLPTDTTPEFWRSKVNVGATDTNSPAYAYGRDPVTGTGTAPNSGIITTGFTAQEWQSPADILAQLAAIDGANVGFYLPYNGRGGYDPPGNAVFGDAGSWWLTAPPQLVYQPFPDPNYAPDYTIHTRQGAVVDPAADTQPLVNNLYVNYQTLRGHQESVVTQDTNTLNYAYAQGYPRSDDYTLQAAGDATQGSSLGQQQLNLRRQPYATATITIHNTGATHSSPILKNGATVPKLATIRPSSMRIVDIPATSNIRSGYATHIEWFGQTLGSDEFVQITLAQPGIYSHQRAHGHLVNRIRSGALSGRKLL